MKDKNKIKFKNAVSNWSAVFPNLLTQLTMDKSS